MSSKTDRSYCACARVVPTHVRQSKWLYHLSLKTDVLFVKSLVRTQFLPLGKKSSGRPGFNPHHTASHQQYQTQRSLHTAMQCVHVIYHPRDN